jgi:phytoene dehydrogenase-like protein
VKNIKQNSQLHADVLVIGAGIAGLTAAALLAKRGVKVCILEQNWLPGGCTSSYPRHGYTFEAGATTLVGLDAGMPLRLVLDETGIEVNPIRLKTPMKVYLKDGTEITRFEDIEMWISEAERVFGSEGQRPFWEYCWGIAQKVWRTSGQQLHFPPSRWQDLIGMARGFSFGQISLIPKAFSSLESLLNRFGLDQNIRFCEFVDEQLLITAQNDATEVNALFGATALCYTNFGNYYMCGGMMGMVKPFVDYIEAQGGSVLLRHKAMKVVETADGYAVETQKHGTFIGKYLLSAIPLNNTLPMLGAGLQTRWAAATMEPVRLRSAFTMGIAFKRRNAFDCLHHQLHLPEPLPQIGGKSIFVSLSHPEDTQRCKPDECIASISTHIFDPHLQQITDKAAIEAEIIDLLIAKDFLRREDILYLHSSSQKSWEKWTGRAHGFVGGYPQYLDIKPWQMKDARLDGKGAYICGDSTYPGQGIPGACLSGIIAATKMGADHGI